MIKYVYPRVGRCGLCNMLYPWARAIVFARANACEVLAPSWSRFNRIGPWLRHERDKRLYLNQFTNIGYVSGLRKLWTLSFRRDEVKMFEGMAGGFGPILAQASLVRKELFRIVSPRILREVEKLPQEFIGVHVRRGDFARIGFALPNDYYLRAVEIARRRVGRDLPILIFTDSKLDEVAYLRRFSNVQVMPDAPAIQDLLALSRAKMLVATNRSTFSGWAAYLGDVPSLWWKDGEAPSASIGLKSFELV